MNLARPFTYEAVPFPYIIFKTHYCCYYVHLDGELIASEFNDSYMKNDFWGFNIWLCAFVGAALVVERIITMIMRHYLSRMKDAATTALQHYQTLMRLIRAHKLRCWLPTAAGVICSLLVKLESDSWPLLIIMSSPIVLGALLGSLMRNWYLDDDFCYDVDQLRDLVDIKGK